MFITLMIMSGVEDGKEIPLDHENDDGVFADGSWTLTIGRHDTRTVRLQKDTYISREHAELHFADDAWVLIDCGSKNGTFVEVDGEPVRVEKGQPTPLQAGQLFKIGRTWLRLQ
jgi:pSer/pThr/pTyr-binding forkhead associated (FHA) protein